MEMTHRYFPHTADDIEQMLGKCGATSLDDLYSDVPEALRMKAPYNVPAQMSEIELRRFLTALDNNNSDLVCFGGAGFYNHYTPSVVPELIRRSEFITAYTPYQPEISQGTLRAIFEYQSMMASLTGLEVSNASIYDGATATAEAMMMTVANARKRSKVVVSETVLPRVRQVVETYAHFHGIDVVTVGADGNGVTDRAALSAELAKNDAAGVIVASPNANGILEDFTGLADECHAVKTLLVMNCHASALGVIKTPGEWGADIAVGEAQSLGMPLSYGGPYLGYMCATKALIRKLPGRIVGATTDVDGNRVFVLTLQAREQHIRREKATSNICSNQGLMVLFASIYLSVVGAEGLREINEVSALRARQLHAALEATGLMKAAYPEQPFLNEFVMTTALDIDGLREFCAQRGVMCGVKVASDKVMFAATEMNSEADIERLVNLILMFNNSK